MLLNKIVNDIQMISNLYIFDAINNLVGDDHNLINLTRVYIM